MWCKCRRTQFCCSQYVECQYASNAAAALYKLYSTLDKDLEMLAMQLLRTPEKKVWQCHSALYNHLKMSAMQLLHIPEISTN